MCRRAFCAGLALALATSASGQDQGVLSLNDALRLSGVEVGSERPAVNPRLAAPQADADAARALIDQARLRPNPEVSLEAENLAGSGAFSGLQATEYTVSVGQRLELGGKRSARIRAATAEARVSELRGALAVAELGLTVRQRYVAAVAAAANAALAADILERNRELARIAGVLVKVGREPPLRALRAQAAVSEAEADLQAADAASRTARAALAALWSDAGPPPPLPASFPEIEPPAVLLAATPRLPVQIAQAERRAAEAGIAREQSLRVPDPVISAGVRRLEQSDDQAFLVGVSVPLPFWNRNQGNVAAAEARLRGAAAREAVIRADYEQSVVQARSDYLAARARVQTLFATSLPQAEEALRLATIGYRNGRFPLIEVLSAAEARDSIRASLISAQEAQGSAAATLISLAATQELPQ
jgi:cobalt-zinc-cadmium efflux system outer membrane protein